MASYLDNFPLQRVSAPARFAATLAIWLAALASRFAADDLLPPGFPFLTFFPAVMIATFVIGTASGIIVAVLSFLSSWYIFLPPRYTFYLTPETATALAFFILVTGIDILIIDLLQKAQRSLRASRQEAIDLAQQRDILFQDLQHRVGNNLAMIAAMLNFQARSEQSEQARRSLQSAAERMRTIGEINRIFYSPDRVEQELNSDFIERLSRACLSANGADERIEIASDVTPISVDQTAFLSIALTLFESISNAVEHGYADGAPGVIRVEGRREADLYRLRIIDDAGRLPDNFDLSKARSVGLTVIKSFAAKLGGSYALKRSPEGTVAEFSFAQGIDGAAAIPAE